MPAYRSARVPIRLECESAARLVIGLDKAPFHEEAIADTRRSDRVVMIPDCGSRTLSNRRSSSHPVQSDQLADHPRPEVVPAMQMDRFPQIIQLPDDNAPIASATMVGRERCGFNFQMVIYQEMISF